MLCQTCLVSRYSSSPAAPELAADAGLLVAAPLRLRDVGVVVVDPHRAHAQPGRDPLGPAGVLGPHRRRPGRRCCRWRSAPRRPRRGTSRRSAPARTTRPGRPTSSCVAAVEQRGQVVEAVGQRRVVGPGPAAAERGALGEPARRRTPRPSRGARRRSAARSRPSRRTGRPAGSARPGGPAPRRTRRGSTPRRPAGRRPSRPGPECRNTAVSAKSSAASRSASANTMLGFLPPSSSATFFTVAGGRGHDPLAGGQAAGERDQVDAGVLAEQRARARSGAEHQVGDARRGRRPPSSSPIRWIAVCGVSSLGLSTKVLPAARHGATFHEVCSSG